MKINILIGMLLMRMAVTAPIDTTKVSNTSEQSNQQPAALNAINDVARAFPGTPSSGQFNTYVLNPSDFGLSLENLAALQALLGNQQSPQPGNSIVPSGLQPSIKTDKLNPTTIFQLYQPMITINHNYVVQPNAKIPNESEEKASQGQKSTSISASEGSMKGSQNTLVTVDKSRSSVPTPSTASSSLPVETTTSSSLAIAVEKAKVNLLNYLLFGYDKNSKAYPKPR